MGNKPSGGIRDGAFVVFKNWDMPMHDIAYYPKLAGRPDDLKNVALSSPGALITAFNTKGWMKTCPFHDFSKWVKSPGCDLYLRVEYPGWHFIQGMDSIGNDIGNSPLSTNVAGLMVNTIVNFPEDKTACVAGFNTDGWVKAKILSELTHFSDSPLDGLYVRTEFQGYEFFQGVDSPGGDITRRSELIDNIPLLITASNSYSNSLGFNTDGWIKSTMKVPPLDKPPSFNVPTKGDYVRVDWPGFVYLPMLDSPGNDAWQLPGKQVWELVDAARADSKIVAFNTSGWMKTSLNDVPVEVPDQDYPLYGLYVKEPNLNTNTAIEPEDVKLYLFIFKATALIWGKWLLADAPVRAEYNRAVYYGSQQIWESVNRGELTPLEGAQHAVIMRNTYLTKMRKKSSPVGLVVAQAIKPEGLPYQTLLDKYAQKRYGKDFAQLIATEAPQVAGDTIDSAGRAEKGLTMAMRTIGYVSKGLIVIGAVVSVYQVVTADDWKFEIGNQVATWSGAIAGGQLGAGVGVIVGPIGAILGGLIGGIIGGIAGEEMAQLARWFFGGSSRRSAEEILGPALLSAAGVAVQKQLIVSDQNFHVHQVLSTHLSEKHSACVVAADIVEDMVTTKSMMRVEVEVVATIVWVVTPQGILPANGANPANLIALMNWAAQNLPSCNGP